MAKPLIMAFQVHVFLALRPVNTSSASSTAPHLAYMSTSAVPRNSSHRSLFFSTNTWTHFPVSNAPALAQADSALTTVPRLGANPSSIIRPKRQRASTGCLFPMCPEIMAFHETRSLSGIFWKTRLADPTSPARQSPATIDVHVTGVGAGTCSKSRHADATSPDTA
uniref:Secreted protein n=1 Tax=Triticum urartu TaxID=4572 RepID=A0A8R7PAZ1_TRIUA